MNVANQNGKELEETLAGSNTDAVKITLKGVHNFKMTLPVCMFFKNFSPFVCHFVTYS